jgi:hypothetical protein
MELLLIARDDLNDLDRDDILVVKPDGHPWGTEERNAAKFKIVKVPGVDERTYYHMNLVDSDERMRRYKYQDGRGIVDKNNDGVVLSRAD